MNSEGGKMNEDIEAFLSLIYTACGKIEKFLSSSGVDISGAVEDLTDEMRLDLSRFAMYLATAHGQMTWNKAALISLIYGEDLTTESIHKAVDEACLLDGGYENMVPPAFQIIVMYDRLMLSLDLGDQPVYESCLGLYDMIGTRLISYDLRPNRDVEVDFNNFMNTLRNHAIEEIRTVGQEEKEPEEDMGDVSFYGGKKQ